MESYKKLYYNITYNKINKGDTRKYVLKLLMHIQLQDWEGVEKFRTNFGGGLRSPGLLIQPKNETLAFAWYAT